MKFCNAIIHGQSFGQFGNCGGFGVDALGFVWLLYHIYTANLSSASSKLLEVNKFKSDSSIKLALTVLHSSCISVGACTLLTSQLLPVEGCYFFSLYFSAVLRCIGWSILIVALPLYFRMNVRFLHGSIGWGSTQVIVAGMNCVYYGFGSGNTILSFFLLVYFILSTCHLVLSIKRLMRYHYLATFWSSFLTIT